MLNTEFVDFVRSNAARVDTYKLGGDGSDGKCDCIGLIIGALRLAGGSWGGTHGSNYAVRNKMRTFAPVASVEDLTVGHLVYKHRAPDASGYALPSGYKSSPDRNDYYHVGVVTGINPLEITHCTKNGSIDGIARDSRQGQWLYGGPLALVDYEGEAGNTAVTIVQASSGKTVKMRAKASAQSGLYWDVPVGAQVKLLARGSHWSQICYGGRTGYMQSRFLKTSGEEGNEHEEGLVTLSLKREAAAALAAALKAAGMND